MKRVFIFLCALLFIPAFVFSQAVSLDTALRNSTTYLNGRLRGGSKVVVLNFTSNWIQLSEYIIDELIGYIVNDGTLTVVDRNNLETIRNELNFQLSGDVSDETASSIGKMLGAQAIISGSISAIGSSYRLRIRTISVETAQILGMQNVDVIQDSRIAALTSTGYAVTVPSSASQQNVLVVPPSAWEHGQDPVGMRHVKFSVSREVIDKQDKDVLTVEVNLPNGEDYLFGQIVLERTNIPIISHLRQATGVRFKALGDGKPWRIYFGTIETEIDWCSYYYEIQTRRNRVVQVNIPYTSLKQPTWGQQVPFYKNSITSAVLQRSSDLGTGTSTIKIFDFEIY
jgi:TolB-like protein